MLDAYTKFRSQSQIEAFETAFLLGEKHGPNVVDRTPDGVLIYQSWTTWCCRLVINVL